jgi:hypothetical protein
MTFFRRSRVGSLAIGLALLLHLSLAPLSAQVKATTSATWLYELVQFDLPDVQSTRLGGINNQNDVVGSTFDGVRIRPFLVSAGVVSFPALPDGAFPEDINDLGQIVGEFYGLPGYGNGPYGFVYSSGTWQFAAPLLPFLLSNSYALGINNHGHVVGSYTMKCPPPYNDCPGPSAYFTDLTDPSRSYTEVGAFAGINDWGDILGAGDTPISVPEAVGTIANDINNVSTIVGAYWGSNDTYPMTHGFVLSNGRYVSIDFPGASSTSVEGVNDTGVIVGSYTIGREGHGFVGIPRSPVDVTINGADGPVTIDAGQPLQVQLQFTAPPVGALNPAEVYIGVVSPIGLLWLDPATGTFVPTPTRTFAGALPSFGPTPLVNLPDGAALPSGTWWWFMIVDDDSNGTIEGAFFDVAQMIVP